MAMIVCNGCNESAFVRPDEVSKWSADHKCKKAGKP